MREIEARKREARALELRAAGWTYAQIAAELGCTLQGARAMVLRALDRLGYEDAEKLRRLELRRLDRLLEATWEKAIAGDLGAVDRVLRIMEVRARLAGLNAPEKRQVEAAIRSAVKWETIAPWLTGTPGNARDEGGEVEATEGGG